MICGCHYRAPISVPPWTSQHQAQSSQVTASFLGLVPFGYSDICLANLIISSLCAHRAMPRPRLGLRYRVVAGSPGRRKVVDVQGMAAFAPLSGEEVSGQGGEGLWVFLHTHVVCYLLGPIPSTLSAHHGRGSRPQAYRPHCPHAGRDLRVVRFFPSPPPHQFWTWPLSSEYLVAPAAFVWSQLLTLAFQALVAIAPTPLSSLYPSRLDSTQLSPICLANSSYPSDVFGFTPPSGSPP